MKPSDTDLEALEAEHGKLFLVPFGVDGAEAPTVDNAEHVFVIRRPRAEHFSRFEKDCLDPKRQVIGIKNLAIDAIVWPPKAERDEIVAEYPGALTLCGGEAAALARGDAVERAKRWKASTGKVAATR